VRAVIACAANDTPDATILSSWSAMRKRSSWAPSGSVPEVGIAPQFQDRWVPGNAWSMGVWREQSGGITFGLSVPRAESVTIATGLRVRVSRPRSSMQPQILAAPIPRRKSCSGLLNSSKGQTATGDFEGIVPDQRQTPLPPARLGRPASRQHQAIPARDKTIRAVHHSKACLGSELHSSSAQSHVHGRRVMVEPGHA